MEQAIATVLTECPASQWKLNVFNELAHVEIRSLAVRLMRRLGEEERRSAVSLLATGIALHPINPTAA